LYKNGFIGKDVSITNGGLEMKRILSLCIIVMSFSVVSPVMAAEEKGVELADSAKSAILIERDTV